MGSSHDLAVTASIIDRGVLAAKVASLLAAQPGQPLRPSEVQAIGNAADMVHEILAGARTITGEGFAGASAQGVISLGFALTPLEHLRMHCEKKTGSDDSIVKLLTEIHSTLEKIAKQELNHTAESSRVLAKQFFDFLADSLLSSLDHDYSSDVPR